MDDDVSKKMLRDDNLTHDRDVNKMRAARATDPTK